MVECPSLSLVTGEEELRGSVLGRVQVPQQKEATTQRSLPVYTATRQRILILQYHRQGRQLDRRSNRTDAFCIFIPVPGFAPVSEPILIPSIQHHLSSCQAFWITVPKCLVSGHDITVRLGRDGRPEKVPNWRARERGVGDYYLYIILSRLHHADFL